MFGQLQSTSLAVYNRCLTSSGICVPRLEQRVAVFRLLVPLVHTSYRLRLLFPFSLTSVERKSSACKFSIVSQSKPGQAQTLLHITLSSEISQKMFYTIYKTVNLLNGKFYVECTKPRAITDTIAATKRNRLMNLRD